MSTKNPKSVLQVEELDSIEVGTLRGGSKEQEEKVQRKQDTVNT